MGQKGNREPKIEDTRKQPSGLLLHLQAGREREKMFIKQTKLTINGN